MNMKQTLIKTFVFAAISLCLTACEKDADNDIDMQSFATLNMMNEQNGKNYLDKTDIFIDNANNFSSKFWYIADLDTKKDDTRGGTPFDMTNIGHLFAVHNTTIGMKRTIQMIYVNFLQEKQLLKWELLFINFMPVRQSKKTV